MNYEELKIKTNNGWNTWNTANVLSYVHLPEGFAINLCIRQYTESRVLRESLIGRHGDNEEKIVPKARTYDGKCTDLTLTFRDLELEVKTTVCNDEQIIIVDPLKCGSPVPTLIIEACLLWGKEGAVIKKDGMIYGGNSRA